MQRTRRLILSKKKKTNKIHMYTAYHIRMCFVYAHRHTLCIEKAPLKILRDDSK